MRDFPELLRVGTCSWKYDSWKGILYSENVGKNYLSEYSKHFNIVEVGQWFWSLFGDKVVLPKPEVVDEYVSSVPRDFKFSIKVPNSITLTHQYAKGKQNPLEANPHFLSNDLFNDFLALLEPMENNIGDLIFQFEYLNKQKMPNQSIFQYNFLEFIEDCPPGYNYCLEIRNQNYLNAKYFDFIRTVGLTHVFLQGYWMPSIFDLYQKCKNYIEKSTIIRLHGPNRKAIEKKAKNAWNKILDPRDDELDKLVVMIRDLISRDVQVVLNGNHHYEGSAPLTIERFMSRF